MKKIGEYFKQAYISTSAKWFFGVLAALSILPDLIKTILLILTKESLSTGAVFLADLLCVVCASAFAFVAIRSVNGQTKQAAVIWMKGYLPCLAALYAGEILTEFLGGKFGVTGKIIGCAAGGILLGLAFHLLGSAMRGKTKRKACCEIARIGVTVLLALACWYLLPYFFCLGVQAVFSGNKVWSAKLVAGLLNTLFRWALLMPVLKFVCG